MQPPPSSTSLHLTAKHQREALEVLVRCHPVLMDDMCSVFDLQSCDTESQLELVQSLLDARRHKEAVTYAWKFNLQGHFNMEEVHE